MQQLLAADRTSLDCERGQRLGTAATLTNSDESTVDHPDTIVPAKNKLAIEGFEICDAGN